MQKKKIFYALDVLPNKLNATLICKPFRVSSVALIYFSLFSFFFINANVFVAIDGGGVNDEYHNLLP